MTTATISTTVSNFSFGTTYNVLSITASGYVDGGTGVVAVNGEKGTQADTVFNNGKILGEAYLGSGGSLTNGSATDTSAQITCGGSAVITGNAVGAVHNFGTITALDNGSAAAVYLESGGSVTNGSGVDATARIIGGYGVWIRNATGTVLNYGSIVGDDVGNRAPGAYMAGGLVTNGSSVDTSAVIIGGSGVLMTSAGTVRNFGAIESTDTYAISMREGGAITNGSATDQAAIINGIGIGLDIAGAGVVTNFGVIKGQGGDAVYMTSGTLTNGAGSDRNALIEGYQGVVVRGAATVNNFATIASLGTTYYGLYVAGGSLTNGALSDKTALIEGAGGVELRGALTGVNFGTIEATGISNGFGAVSTASGVTLTNGAAGDTTALIEGYVGAQFGAGTLINFGAIYGSSGEAVAMSAGSTLAVEAGSTFIGSIVGNGATLELASGVGTLTGLLGSGDVTVSGSMATTRFTDFGGVQIDAGASFTLAGAGGSVGPGQSLVIAGSLSGAGTLTLTGGTTTLDTGASFTVAKVNESGAAAVVDVDAPSLTLADVWTQTAGTITVATGDKVTFTGTGDSFDGALSGAGTVDFTAGTDALTGTNITAVTGISGTATVTLSGSVNLTSTLSVTSPDVLIAATGATFSGGGAVSLSNLTTNVIKGASAAAKLTNSDTIKGAGQLGDGEMALTNAAGGVIQANQTTALIVNLGAGTLGNAGLIESTAAGGLTVDGAVSNTGTLEVTAGTLAVDGAVSGSGAVKISGGTADFGSTFVENVTFTSTGGVLELADATSYTGEITGFAKTTVSSLDLLDITFGSKTTATFSGTTTSGVLTVTDGTHTAMITLEGNYTASTFTVASDGHGGTTVTDPTKAIAATPPPQPWRIGPEPVFPYPLVTAMAGFGAETGGASTKVGSSAHPTASLLASPMVNAA